MYNKLPTLSKQQGFTLIELMIAITLGLLISAAALMIFLSSQRSLAIQNGLSDIQQNAIFGLRTLTYDLRHTNLDTNAKGRISKTELGSGIVFDPTQVASIVLTPNQVTTANKDTGIMTVNNDQLTIQFKARTGNMTDCEGTQVPADTVVVQRYYVAALPNNQQPSAITNDNRRYGLFCDAAWGAGSAMGAGETVAIADVDSFKISLVTRNLNSTVGNRKDDNLRYQTLASYINNPMGDLVASIEIGVVLRSSGSVHSDKNIEANPTFKIAGQDVKLANPPTTANYLRVPLTQVVAIRNSQGVE